jgi:hypothetical protein
MRYVKKNISSCYEIIIFTYVLFSLLLVPMSHEMPFYTLLKNTYKKTINNYLKKIV